ncbi:MAG TPA: hypothetical protein VGG34_03080 [Opitutaceae bacterium]|jgi:hypothetical protein
MTITTYLVVHLSAIIVLLGYTFYAFAAPAETKGRVMMVTGVAALVVLLSGVGMLVHLHLGFPAWAKVKFGCWIVLGCMAAVGYRRRAQADLFMIITFAAAILAVTMVYLRPF